MGHAYAQAVTHHRQGQRGCAAQQFQHGEDDTQFRRLQRQAMAQALKERPEANLPRAEQEEKCQRCISRRREPEACQQRVGLRLLRFVNEVLTPGQGQRA
ncbi:hypothetical protein D3C81_1310010 [compost metagenome]